MTLEYVANTDLQTQWTAVPGSPPTRYATGYVKITRQGVSETVSTKVKAGGKYVCTTRLDFAWAVAPVRKLCPMSSSTHDFVAGTGFLMATATKTKVEGFPVLRANDTGTCTGSWKLKASPYNLATCSCTMKIFDAGQTKVKAQ